jgi:3-hydroxymyristoyl/3-hydroxydecanoyl-(acyl carrier protein) dehydratase
VSTSGWTEGAALEEFLPHRGVNMLIDSFSTEAQVDRTIGETKVTVSPGDASGRDIFLRESGDGTALLEPALAEYLALGAICVLRPEMALDEIAFFSVISNFESFREARGGETLIGTLTRLRDKGRFRRFEGAVRGEDGADVASAEIMAYTAAPSASTDKRESTRLLKPPVVADVKGVDRSAFPWKRPEMVFIDDMVDISADLTDATFRYTYPDDHPFCPGHFPGNPVMMGITQWIAAADAAAWLVVERARKGMPAPAEGRLQADVDIVRQAGTIVTEIKQMTLALGADAQTLTPVRVLKTKRVGFRDQVRPGETIFIRARIAPGE